MRVILLLVCIIGGWSVNGLSIDVNTDKGVVQGTYNVTTNLVSFIGIPYARPPVGDLRWRVPQPAAPWSTPLVVNTFSPACIQQNSPYYTFPPDIQFSEDCLYLNVWAPNTTGLKPVMVWIHGGALENGGNSELRLRGEQMSSTANVVVVNLNYRLGILGWLAHSAFSQDDPNRPAIGNYGLADQVLALTWIKNNIQNFGGDPNLVTIMGNSAGGTSVTLHLVSPRSKGLFNQVVAESSASFVEVAQLTDVEQASNQLQAYFNCNGDTPSVIKCLRSISPDQIVAYQSLKPIGAAVVNNYELFEHPFNSLTNNRINPVKAIISGNVKNEGTVFVGLKRPVSETAYTSFAYSSYSSFAPLVLEQYPCAQFNSSDCFYAAAAVIGDCSLVCPNYVLASSLASTVPTFTYVFTHSPYWGTPDLGAFHSSEVAFVFSTLPFVHPYTPNEVTLANQMTTMWTTFGKTSKPDPNWPQFVPGTDGGQWMTLDVGLPAPTVGYKQKECLFWRNYYSIIFNY